MVVKAVDPPSSVRTLVEGAKRGPVPLPSELMLATLTSRRFSDPAWLFERKLDGQRCLAYIDGTKVRLVSRSGSDLTSTYPEIASRVGGGELEFAVDGELVAFDGEATSFARLQARLGVAHPSKELIDRVPVVYCIFDVLHSGGRDLRSLPLRARKDVLRALVSPVAGLELVAHRDTAGEAYFDEACRRGWEGVIAKKADGPYRSGRSADWLKFKCVRQQELVIGGYTDPTGSREDFGALLVGYYDGPRLVYAGKVGTGFTKATLAQLGRRLRRLERRSSPFAEVHPVPKGTHWVAPTLVAEIAFAEWTRDGRLRQPRYLGLRDDKPARSVTRERETS